MNKCHTTNLNELRQLGAVRFQSNSQKILPGDVFVCRQGPNWDSHQSVDEAIGKGAVGVIANKPLELDVPCLLTPSFSNSVSLINQYYQYPQDKLMQIGVTGTNGKTTVAYCLNALLNRRFKSAYTGTLGCQYSDEQVELDNTTPDAISLLNLFHAMEQSGVTHNVMEVSSHALSQDRVSIVDFDVVVITNIGSDHLDYHRSRDEYIQAKLRLIDRLKPGGVAIINLDDELAMAMIERCRSKAQVVTFSMQDPSADMFAFDITSSCHGGQFRLDYDGQQYPVSTSLPFTFNIENSLAVLAMLTAMGIEISTAVEMLATMDHAPGRSEVYPMQNGATAIIDYAHNYDSLRNLLDNVRRHSQGRVYTVIGVTGDRLADAADIGELCSTHSDHAFFTTDNPLGVCLEALFAAMGSKAVGGNSSSHPDRERVIEHAVSCLMPDDVLLLCGKGPEKYQYISSNKSEPQPYIGDFEALMQAAGNR
ncbi:Mur ligase family protein [Photobacterium alginatilyticum]|uniref:UDP-N-acetylmuramoyl-L-alanyl-D-glutamate--2, 6-diaminopimelate ligase n=1 Tax=Photobacterium alginatilyticum TaxID=1775171 RepID=A0ABW9YHG2_9GAMM|nr:UDP-N-acetylmuramoyl-L-alanyl-D-glutamate--2,6-diaminopimelate ligase [Photobacterium alginatilyticum]NBI53264.1 UDP-N-acetylmuramoyl-L-alanyl-D-glutamate--2,6-diaminopimelate ligase [Photobacterium alginatilyticum]